MTLFYQVYFGHLYNIKKLSVLVVVSNWPFVLLFIYENLILEKNVKLNILKKTFLSKFAYKILPRDLEKGYLSIFSKAK